MELLDTNRSVLVVVDLQGRLVEMVHRSKTVLAATVRLLRLADLFAVPVILTEQYPQGLGLDVSQHGEEAYTSGEGAILVLSEARPAAPLGSAAPLVAEAGS